MNTNLEVIKAKCIAANPEIETRGKWNKVDPQFEGTDVGVSEFTAPPIRLADVLLAIRHAPNGIASANGVEGDLLRIIASVGRKPFFWNLRKDDLTAQDEENIAFLAELLHD